MNSCFGKLGPDVILLLHHMERTRPVTPPLSLTENLINGKIQRTKSNKAKEKLDASGFEEVNKDDTYKFVRKDVPTSLSFALLSLPRDKADLLYFFQIFPKSLIRKIALRNMASGSKPNKVVKAIRVTLASLGINTKIRIEGVPSRSQAIAYKGETKFLRSAITLAIYYLKQPGQKPFGINKIANFLSNFILLDDEVEELSAAWTKCIAVRLHFWGILVFIFKIIINSLY